jgi:toxin-antitoxin system PIN domain toxin
VIGIDTNLLIYARVSGAPEHEKAARFLETLGNRTDVVLAELVLVEFYLALRNPAIVSPALDAPEAVMQCDALRRHPRWRLAENAEVMGNVWQAAARPGFARRRIIDVRLALTLQAHGVNEFATANTRDFQELGFRRVWNPLEESV